MNDDMTIIRDLFTGMLFFALEKSCFNGAISPKTRPDVIVI